MKAALDSFSENLWRRKNQAEKQSFRNKAKLSSLWKFPKKEFCGNWDEIRCDATTTDNKECQEQKLKRKQIKNMECLGALLGEYERKENSKHKNWPRRLLAIFWLQK